MKIWILCITDNQNRYYAYYATDRGVTPIVQFINNSQNYKSPARGPCLRTQRLQIKVGWTIIFV